MVNHTRHNHKILTYIIRTKSNEFYCGKTINFPRRLDEHLGENVPHWFGFKDRKNIKDILKIEGNFEKKIKSFGVKNFYKILRIGV